MALAAEGAKIVVNDLGVARDGEASDEAPADQVVAEIVSAGGSAVASGHDISSWNGAEELIQFAVETFGNLDILVNNAGILRDRSLANMTESEWDDVIRVHLKGHAATSRHAASYWRSRSKSGQQVNASIINTASVAGLFPNFGQTNYGAAKIGIAGLTQALAVEGHSYGLRVNAIAPSAMTRLVPGSSFTVDSEENGFDDMDPDNVSPLVVWLAGENCPASGQIFQMFGRHLTLYQLTSVVKKFKQEGRWSPEQMDQLLPSQLVPVTTAEMALTEVLA